MRVQTLALRAASLGGGVVALERDRMSDLSKSKDESLLVFYENVRQQVDADIRSGGRYRFVGESVKQYADRLSEEMERWRLRFTPIDWQR